MTADEVLEQIPDLPIKRIWRAVGEWEHLPKPRPQDATRPKPFQADVIYVLLRDAGRAGMSTVDLAKATGSHREAVAWHLRQLRGAGRIKSVGVRGAGRWITTEMMQ